MLGTGVMPVPFCFNNSGSRSLSSRDLLVFVIANVLLAVGGSSHALRAVAKFQIGMRDVVGAACGASVPDRTFLSGFVTQSRKATVPCPRRTNQIGREEDQKVAHAGENAKGLDPAPLAKER